MARKRHTTDMYVVDREDCVIKLSPSNVVVCEYSEAAIATLVALAIARGHSVDVLTVS